jgi:tetratricopeptide (TPR) repeat protein
MKPNPFILAAATLLLPVAAFAQSRMSGPPPTALPSSDIGKNSSLDTVSSQGRIGDYLAGKVTVAGGTLPWDAIPVNVVCVGQTRFTASTDPKGNFVIAPTNSAIPAATASTGAPDAKPKLAAAFSGCTVEAALPGFISTSVTVADRNIQDNPDIGTITLKAEASSAGSAVSSTTASAPKDAVKSYEKARAEWQDKKSDKAQKDLEKAVQLDPQFAEAWYQLGKIQEAAKSPDAINSYSKATAADPKFSLPYDHLAPLAAQAGKWQDVADATAHALQLNPKGTPQIWYLDALANYKLGKKDVAETSANRAFSLDPLHTEPNTEQLLAVILVDQQDYSAALEHLRNSLTYLPPGPNLDLVKKQIAQLEQAVATPK